MKKSSKKYIVGGSIVAFGLVLIIIAGCIGGWSMIWNFKGISIDLSGVHYFDEENILQTKGETIMSDGSVKNLKVDVDYGELIIKTGDVKDVEINTRNILQNKFKYEVDGDTLKVKYGSGFSFFSWRSNSYIEITLPKNSNFVTANIKNGAGRTEIDSINADTLKMNNGAGEVVFTNVSIKDKLTMDNGAGAARLEDITCGKLDIDGGVGEIRAKNIICGDIDVNNGIGAFTFDGEINGDANIDNGVGEIRINLYGDSSDYNFKIDSGIGNIKVNGNTPIQSTGGKYDFKIDTGVGEVRVNFEKKGD